MKQVSSLVALCLLGILFLLLVGYVHPGAAGVSYLAGRFLGLFAVIGLIVAVIAKIRGRRFRYDLALWLTAIAVVVTGFSEVIDEYDIRQFEAEIKASGPDKYKDVIANSHTEAAARLRKAIAIAAETASVIGARFLSLTDPVFDQLFDPPKIIDRTVLKKARDIGTALIPKYAEVMPWIDDLMREERNKIFETLESAPSGMAQQFLQGVEVRHKIQRELYYREVDLNVRTFKAVAAVADFLITDAGEYEWSPDGHLSFSSDILVDRFNLLYSKVLAVISETQKLQSDMAAAQVKINESIRAAASGEAGQF